MSIILVLIPLSILFAVAFLAAFIWAVRSGQYEDTCTPSMRLLADESAVSRGVKRKVLDAAGVRPSPGAESNEVSRVLDYDRHGVCPDNSAPEDGRTPVKVNPSDTQSILK